MTSSIQKRAAKLHSKVPADYYSRSIEENPLHRFWHTTRFKQVSGIVKPVLGKVLDIGCADGTFTKIILEKTKAKKVIGIDVLEKSIKYAKEKYKKEKRLSFEVEDAHKLPFGNSEFDAVFCLETLEHVENPQKVVSEIHRVLKPNGYAIILVPNENFLFKAGWKVWLLGPGRVWRDTHIQDLSSGEILRVLENEGFRIDKAKKFILGMLQVVYVTKR